ncbi:MAG: M28 family peptidase [Sphingomonadales bacterium]|nr:M28 family peptidase [Sphingomonadales bacterium]
MKSTARLLQTLVVMAAIGQMPSAWAAAAISEDDLRPHIEILASDAFEGREPGTEGERKTLEYLQAQWKKAGLKAAARDGSWLEPVAMVRRVPVQSSASYHSGKDRLRLSNEDIVLIGLEANSETAAMPTIFVGYGVNAQGEVVADVRDKAVFMLTDRADFLPEKLLSSRSRREALANKGAAAVIAVSGEQFEFTAIKRQFQSRPIRLDSNIGHAPIEGAVSSNYMVALVTAAGGDWDKLRLAAKAPDYAGQLLNSTASFKVETGINRFNSHNIIGKIKGRKSGSGTVMFMGHWDHLGICRPEGAADRICNGAVDNASGMAVLTEVARSLSRGKHDRDIVFVGTTGEESGLLGAKAYAAAPTVPLDSIKVLLNVDTIAIAPRGAKVSIIGRGTTPLDGVIENVARKLGRTIEPSTEANAFLERQDGWAFTQKGVPALMVGGSFADPELLQSFLDSDYHGPDDEAGSAIELGGAAEDASLHVELGKYFASNRKFSGTDKAKGAGE